MNNTQLHQHYPAMVKAAQRIVRCPEEAADCASDALLQLLDRGESGDVSESLAVTIAKRRAVDVVRAQDTRRRNAPRLVMLISEEAADPAERVCDVAEARWLEEVGFTQLRPRVMSVLSDVAAGSTTAEIAAARELPLRTVQSQLALARKVLQRAAAGVAALVTGTSIAIRRLLPSLAVAPALIVTVALLLLPDTESSKPPAASPVLQLPPTNFPAYESVLTVAKPLAQHLESPRKVIRLTARPSDSKPEPKPTETVVRTPVAVVGSYDTDNGRDDDAVEGLLYCANHVTITLSYAGC